MYLQIIVTLRYDLCMQENSILMKLSHRSLFFSRSHINIIMIIAIFTFYCTVLEATKMISKCLELQNLATPLVQPHTIILPTPPFPFQEIQLCLNSTTDAMIINQHAKIVKELHRYEIMGLLQCFDLNEVNHLQDHYDVSDRYWDRIHINKYLKSVSLNAVKSE